jgi:hypothetical protein
MPKAYEQWTVTAHGPIEKIAENLWRVQAKFPGAPIDREMILARLPDGRIIVHNAIALGDAEMREIESWGTPSFLIVPNGGHRLDARIWKTRYPSLRVVAPPGAKQKVEQVVAVDDTAPDFGDGIRYQMFEGTEGREGVLVVPSASGTSLVFTDVLMNMHKLPGFGGFMMGLAGFVTKAPRVTFPARMALVKNKGTLRDELSKLADTPGLARLYFSHGVPVSEGAAVALREAAAAL